MNKKQPNKSLERVDLLDLDGVVHAARAQLARVQLRDLGLQQVLLRVQLRYARVDRVDAQLHRGQELLVVGRGDILKLRQILPQVEDFLLLQSR